MVVPWWRRRSDTSVHQTCDKNDREEEEVRLASSSSPLDRAARDHKHGHGHGHGRLKQKKPSPSAPLKPTVMFTTTLRPRRAPLATTMEEEDEEVDAEENGTGSATATADDDVLSNMLGVVGSREFFAEFFEQPAATSGKVMVTAATAATATTTATEATNSNNNSNNNNPNDWKDPRVQRKLLRLHEEFQREVRKLDAHMVHPEEGMSVVKAGEQPIHDDGNNHDAPWIHAAGPPSTATGETADTSSVLSSSSKSMSMSMGTPMTTPTTVHTTQFQFNKFRTGRDSSYKSLPAPTLPTIPPPTTSMLATMVTTNGDQQVPVTNITDITDNTDTTDITDRDQEDTIATPPDEDTSCPARHDGELPASDPNHLIQWLQERRSLLEEIRHRTDLHVQRWKSKAQQESARRQYLERERLAERDSWRKQWESERLSMLRWKEECDRTTKDQDAKVEFYQQQVQELLTRQSILLQKNHRYREELVLLVNENDSLKRMLKGTLDRLDGGSSLTAFPETANDLAPPPPPPAPSDEVERLRSEVEYWKRETRKGQLLCKEMVEELAHREIPSGPAVDARSATAPG